MSRGPGHIERAIARYIESHKTAKFPMPVLVRTWDVLQHFHPGYAGAYAYLHWEPTTVQRKAAVRALHSFVRKHQQYALTGGKGRKQLVLYEADDPLSVMWAKLTVEHRDHVSCSAARAALVAARSSPDDG